MSALTRLNPIGLLVIAVTAGVLDVTVGRRMIVFHTPSRRHPQPFIVQWLHATELSQSTLFTMCERGDPAFEVGKKYPGYCRRPDQDPLSWSQFRGR